MAKHQSRKGGSESESTEPEGTPEGGEMSTLAEATPEAAVQSPAVLPAVIDALSLTDKELATMLASFRAETRRRLELKQSARPTVGQQVRILRGAPKYVGKIGTAVIVRKTRCFVTVPEFSSPCYCLIGDLEIV